MASMYGLMRITPVAPDIIRVSFVKGVTEKNCSYGLDGQSGGSVFMERQGIQKRC